jgi:hypothetical protein
MQLARTRQHLGFFFLPTLILFSAVFAGKCDAWDLRGKPFGFRLQFTDDRTTNFFPTAHPILALNPAGDDFTREPPFAYNVLGGLVSENGHFGNGGGVSINSAIALIRLPGDGGTIAPVLGRTDVYDSTTRQGQDFNLRTNAFTLRYSRHVSANWTLGGSIKLAQNYTALADSAVKFGAHVIKAEYTLGILGSPKPNWTTGLMITQAPAWADSRISTGGGVSEIRSQTLLTRVRGGIGWRPAADSGVYLDGQYLRVRDKNHSANFFRVMLMAEKSMTPTLPMRAGITVDSAGQASPSIGFGVYNLLGVNVDLNYAYNANPEINREVGRTNYWMLVLSRMF